MIAGLAWSARAPPPVAPKSSLLIKSGRGFPPESVLVFRLGNPNLKDEGSFSAPRSIGRGQARRRGVRVERRP